MQTWAIAWFIASDQRKAISLMSLMLITTGWSIRDRLLCVKGILAGYFAVILLEGETKKWLHY
jgi:hypothetical protein